MFKYFLLPLAGLYFLLWAGASFGFLSNDVLNGAHVIVAVMTTISCATARGRYGSDVRNSAVFIVWIVTMGVTWCSYLAVNHIWWVGMLNATLFLAFVGLAAFAYAWFRPTPEDYFYHYPHPKWGVCMIQTNGRSMHETEKEIRAIQRAARAELASGA